MVQGYRQGIQKGFPGGRAVGKSSGSRWDSGRILDDAWDLVNGEMEPSEPQPRGEARNTLPPGLVWTLNPSLYTGLGQYCRLGSLEADAKTGFGVRLSFP